LSLVLLFAYVYARYIEFQQISGLQTNG